MRVVFLFLISCLFIFSACKDKNDVIKFGVSADYPPFEYIQDGKLKGFDVELAEHIGKTLQKEVEFSNMQFSAILPALQSGMIDAGISSIAVTKERSENFDFSDVYFQDKLSVLYKKNTDPGVSTYFKNKKVACQLGTTMEIWLKKNAPLADLLIVDNNSIAVESLKADHVSSVLLDSFQAMSFANSNQDLTYKFVANSGDGYAIVLKKNSKLKSEFNEAIAILRQNGKLAELEKKWSIATQDTQ